MNFIDPEDILDKVKLRSGMVGAEFGCGSGHWALALARHLNKGTVYAIDLQAEPLSALRGKAEQAMISNIKTRKRNLEKPEGSGLEKWSISVVLIPNLLFQIEKKEEVLKEAKRILEPNGFLIIVDWKKEGRLLPNQPYITAYQVKAMVQKLGFTLLKELPAGTSHYALVFQKENE